MQPLDVGGLCRLHLRLAGERIVEPVELLGGLAAIALEGAKGVGKTATAVAFWIQDGMLHYVTPHDYARHSVALSQVDRTSH
mgnify:CR=1 FL=1